jgi:4-hydroxy-2-oxoheptanedioate aldolase
MNVIEREMVELLKKMKEKYGVIEIKAEFEAEGSRIEEMMRLKDVTSAAGLPIILKIGGTEALTDIYNAIILGVSGIIAPMIETPYSLSKYLDIIDSKIQPDNAEDIDFAFNIETLVAAQNLDEMMKLENFSRIDGITLGRSDFTQSMGLNKSEINTDQILEHAVQVGIKAANQGVEYAVGGNINSDSINFLRALKSRCPLKKYETRKVVFDSSSLDSNNLAEGISSALNFELLWMRSKQRFYSKIKEEDEHRIIDLTKRLG